ncbi:MAG: aminotransferase class I/II-fold pyridoxal phosphate-dependent enzyme [Actinobacteria bacterium]|nr:aminotransferase class I/II-fold pyridoxal phosphate-dependent enzyme [Actinomycetota bacterium]
MAEAVRAPELNELRGRKSSKWSTYPSDVLPLPVAEMDFPIAEPIKQALHDMVNRSDTGYLGPMPELFEAFANFADTRWGWKVDPTHIRTATDAGVAVVEVIRTLLNPGEKLLVSSPVYENFWTWPVEVKATLIDVPLKQDGENYWLDLDAIEREYRAGVRVHLLCYPHNPVGVIFSKEALISLASLARKYGVVIISDEIHGPLVYKGRDFLPFMALSDDAREVCVAISGTGKAFNLAGLKCALIITGSAELKKRINTMPEAVSYRTSIFGAVAATAAFSQSIDWLDGVIATLEENRVLVRNLIDSKIPVIKYREPDFSYLAWLDVSALDLGDDPAKYLLERGKVAFKGGYMYGPKHRQYIRFNFGTSPEIITEAFDRFLKAL